MLDKGFGRADTTKDKGIKGDKSENKSLKRALSSKGKKGDKGEMGVENANSNPNKSIKGNDRPVPMITSIPYIPIVMTNSVDENWGFLSDKVHHRTTAWLNLTNHLKIHGGE